MSNPYVIRLERLYAGSNGVETGYEYLVAISLNPYAKARKEIEPPVTTHDPRHARYFIELAAAEVVAAMVGGGVRLLSAAIEDYKRNNEDN